MLTRVYCPAPLRLREGCQAKTTLDEDLKQEISASADSKSQVLGAGTAWIQERPRSFHPCGRGSVRFRGWGGPIGTGRTNTLLGAHS
eukprot:11131357-Alexandrium_andersonii.AAC.1